MGEPRLDKISVENILHDLNYGKLVNHKRNRKSGQWDAGKKTACIDSILRGMVILPFTVEQQGLGIDAVMRIIDGGQRISTIEAYKNNEFKIGSKIQGAKLKPVEVEVPVMVDKLDENGKVVKELLPGRKRRTPVKVPLMGENGYPVREKKEFSIANKCFKDLPVELQQEFLRYDKMCMVNMINCTDEEVREQMRRFNMGTSMNPAQLGMIVSSEHIFDFINETVRHDLFKNCSNWTNKDIIKDAIERCITESYVLMYEADSWGSYTQICALFNRTATDKSLKLMRAVMDKLAEIIDDNNVIIDNLNKKNLHLILGNFKMFIDTYDYKISDYARFLCDWFDHLKEASGYDEHEEKATKSKSSIMARLNILSEELEKWLNENGTPADEGEYDIFNKIMAEPDENCDDDDDCDEDEDDEEVWDVTAEESKQSDTDNTSDSDDDDLWGNTPENNSNTIDSNTVELNEDTDAANEQTQAASPSTVADVEPNPTEPKPSTETLKIYADMTGLTTHDVVRRRYNQEPGYVNDYMTKAMMTISDMNGYHFKGYSDKYIHDYINEFNNQPASDRDTQVDDCKYYLDCLDGYLINVPSDSDFITDENMLCLMNVIKSAQSNETDDDTIRDWVIKFVDEYDEHSRFANMSSDNHDYVIMGKISYLSSELSKYVSDLWVDGM